MTLTAFVVIQFYVLMIVVAILLWQGERLPLLERAWGWVSWPMRWVTWRISRRIDR